MGKTKVGRQTAVFTAVMLLLLAAVAVSAWHRAKSTQKISYAEHIEDTAVTIDGTKYKFRDLAFYLAHQELVTQEQAKVYDLEQTSKYWNLHANGSFVRLEAKDQALEMAVHDVVFYQMAAEAGTELTEEEILYMENQKADFWSDLEEEGQKRLGVSMEELDEVFLHMALAQKEQQKLADRNGVDYREYNVNGSMYLELLKEHTYEINEKLWERLNFGNIIIN